MELIEGPYKKAFSTTNIIKVFEVTGTWPVDCPCITSDKTAPAMALSSHGKATIPQSSPIKNFLKTYHMFPAPLGNNAPNLASTTVDNPEGLNSTKIQAIEELREQMKGTHASFLFDGSAPSAQNEICPLQTSSIVPRENSC